MDRNLSAQHKYYQTESLYITGSHCITVSYVVIYMYNMFLFLHREQILNTQSISPLLKILILQ